MRVESISSDQKVKFEDIRIGECFWAGDHLYIRVEDFAAKAVNLRTGHLHCLYWNQLVLPEPRAKIIFDQGYQK
jgi:hypothetical protein